MIGRRHLLAGLAAGALPGAVRAAAPPAYGPRDLDGIWTNASYTLLERPDELAGKGLALTPAEAEAFEAPRRAQHGMAPSKPGTVGQAESEFNELGDGLLRMNGQIRSSLITDPADGKIPWAPDVERALRLADRDVSALANPETRPNNERCLTSYASGPPLLPGPDTSVFQFVQTPGAIAIYCEKYHDVRTVWLGGPPPGLPHSGSSPLPQWNGTSVGRWDGDALVVETTGFRRGITGGGNGVYVSGGTRVTERFRRTGAAEITYGFTVEDPALYTQPWSGEGLFRPAPAIFEYACHEGNYGLPDILGSARYEEKAAGK